MGTALSDRRQLSRKLRVSLVQHCNFECFFCHNEGQRSARAVAPMAIEEIVQLCEAAVDAGVSEIKLTGGEPLLYRHPTGDVVALVAALSRVREGRCVGLSITTNGLLLERLAQPLHAAGLDRATVSLHTLEAGTLRAVAYRRATQSTVDRVVAGLRAAAAAQLAPLKVNTVLFGPSGEEPGNLDELPRIVEACRAAGVHELRLYTLLSHDGFDGAAFHERYRFWDENLLTRVADALTAGAGEAAAIVAAGERFAAGWADVLYPKPTLRLQAGELIVTLEAMRHARFAVEGISDEGPYALRLSAHGELTGTLGDAHSLPMLRMLRDGADRRTLAETFAAARRDLLPPRGSASKPTGGVPETPASCR